MRLGTAVLVGSTVLAWLLWPLGDARLAIRLDETATRAARDHLSRPPAAGRARPPNVVLIVADDGLEHYLYTRLVKPGRQPQAVRIGPLRRQKLGTDRNYFGG